MKPSIYQRASKPKKQKVYGGIGFSMVQFFIRLDPQNIFISIKYAHLSHTLGIL